MININNKAQFDDVLSKNDIVVVDFYADWCGPCKSLGKMLAAYEGKTTIVKIDCDAMGDLASEYGVRSIPFVIKIQNGSVVDQFVGLPDAAKLERFLG